MSPAQLQHLLQTALTHHNAGRLAEAEKLYRQVRTAQPNHFDALHLSGVVAYQQGRYKEAIELYLRSLKINPKSSVCEMRLGLAYGAMGQQAEAEKRLRSAVASDPRLVDAWMGLAVTLRVLGRIREAIECYQKVVALQPKHFEAHDQIGALTSDTQGPAAGLPHFRRAVECNPKFAQGWCNLGLAVIAGDNFGEAISCFTRALTLDPKLVQARVGLALAYQQTYQLEKALAEFDAALAAQPDHHQARSGKLLTLNYLAGITREQAFAAHLDFARAAGGATPEVHALTGPATPSREPPRTTPALQSGCERQRVDAPPPASGYERERVGSSRPLRLAFLSPDLRAHSVAYFLEPLLQHLDRSRFEIYLYHDHFKTDAVSERLRQHAKLWRNFVGQLDPVVEATIRSDAPDILIDLAGHTGLNRLPLFARRLAPVQISYLGYPNTTGLAEMDFRFVDPITDPDETDQRFHTEKLVRFSPCAWVYQPPASAPEPLPSSPAAPNSSSSASPSARPFTFGSFNNLAKLSAETLQLWSRLLGSVSDAKLLIKGQGLGDPLVRANIEAKFRAAGIDLARVEFLGRTPNIASHLELYHRVDIALDAFPYHGTTTTCEALWMGVPVVTLRGDRHASRVGASLLTAVSHPEWIANSADEYVNIAATLAANRPALSTLRSQLRRDMAASILLDHSAQAARFADAIDRCRSERLVR
jgi:protein O-GlcNAc transferase